jgi:hypothetical protein
MHVLEREDDRSLPCERFQPADIRVLNPVRFSRVVGTLDPYAEEPAERGEHLLEVVSENRAESGPSLRPHGDLGLPDLRPEPSEESVDEGPCRDPAV